MSTTEGTLCICSKPAANRCSACKIVSYCSAKCQRADWKAHKTQCKAASQGGATGSRVPQVGSSTQLSELVRVGAQYTIYDDCMALGLNPDLISGASGEEFYQDKDGAGNFWRLDAPVREQWEAKAQVHNRKSQRFWTTYLSPISIGREWIDVVLDGRTPRETPEQQQRNVAEPGERQYPRRSLPPPASVYARAKHNSTQPLLESLLEPSRRLPPQHWNRHPVRPRPAHSRLHRSAHWSLPELDARVR
ncbi:hypothetical protein B0H16DRAFT_527355 [Mycena metata]|uniref:MYND-type domain-containing protein n=1 Tax=Mycena metata TaxID=1033252 RepID=A0AAD7JCP0_9AGAR|nr:hypothetical protein B0H16DRAFT_527355 [Mycena metata]